MFGIFRLGLAILVIMYHLSGRHPVGWYSVYAFYVLSGFLMTLVIRKKYAFCPGGAKNFLLNRSLRIYPPYLAVCITSIVLLHLPQFAATATELVQAPAIGLPDGPSAWFENIFIWGWHMRDPKLIPQVWSVFRELFYCALIFLVFARHRWLAFTWFIGSLAYAIWTVAAGLHFVEIYNSFKTASIAYSAGCCLMHFQKSLRWTARPLFPLIGIVAGLPFVLEAVRPRLFDWESIVPFYINVGLSSYLVLLLSHLRGSEKWKAIDQYLGNLSYPIYLCHFNVAIILITFLHWPVVAADRLLLVCFVPVVIASWAINKYVERTIGYGYDRRRQEAAALKRKPVLEPAESPAPLSWANRLQGAPSLFSAVQRGDDWKSGSLAEYSSTLAKGSSTVPAETGLFFVSNRLHAGKDLNMPAIEAKPVVSTRDPNT